MITIVLVIHVLIAVAMVGVILLQRSEGGALGIGGGGGGGGGLMTGRGAANLLTRSTAILAVAFFATSIALAFLSGSHTERRSILDQPATEAP
ncbi:MAG: preprotein translocase subunit SecG, partial [Minwuiales bacterium]|nr:preprotein translocase subunit SecG [Minwuiales bacterium]